MTEAAPTPLLTRDALLAMYSQYLGALAAEVSLVFRPLRNDEDRIKHNIAIGHFSALFPDAKSEQLMWQNVAQALLNTARQKTGDKTDGKK